MPPSWRKWFLASGRCSHCGRPENDSASTPEDACVFLLQTHGNSHKHVFGGVIDIVPVIPHPSHSILMMVDPDAIR